MVDTVEWACVLCVSMCTEQVEQKSASNFMLRLNIPLWKLFGWFRRLQLWAAGDWQLHHNNAPTHASPRLMQSFLVKHQITQVTQPHYTLQLLAFPKTKITLEREQISDHWWDSGQHSRAAGGDFNKGFCRVFWTVEEVLRELCEVPRFLLWRGLRHHCPVYNVSCILYLFQ